MQFVQNILLIVGASALGAVTCGAGLAIFAALTFLSSRPSHEPGTDWGAAIAFAFCGISGSVLGGIAGLVTAIRWIMQGRGRTWTLPTWIGIVLGVALALAIRFSEALNRYTFGHLIVLWPGMALFLTAAATLGGLLGSLARPVPRLAKRKTRGRRKPRKEKTD